MNNDLISRSALFKAWDALDETQDPNLLVDAMIKATQEATAVDAEPVRHSKWLQHRMSVPKGKGQTYLVYGCWMCRGHVKKRSPYCPNCGAKMMDGDEHAAD